jgi:fucose permease
MMVTVQIILRPSYFSIKGSVEENTNSINHSWKPLAIISLIGLIVMVSEGAVADWSALYLKNVSKLKLEWIGLGYAGFSMLMATGRFVGDWVSHRFGSWQIISFGLCLALLGFGLVILPLSYFNLFGFSIIGLGFSVIVPEIYRLASRTEGIETTAGVSFIAGTANVGFLLGPVIIGFIAELYTLRFSFIMLMGLVFAALTIALIQRRKAIRK